MQEKLMRSTTFITSVLALVAMSVMLKFAATKTIVIAEEVTSGSGAGQEYVQKKLESAPLLLKEDETVASSICIPLPEEIRPDDIVIENHYMERRINVIIKGAEKDYYKEKDYYNRKEVVGTISRIQEAVCYADEEAGTVVLTFRMDGLYEHQYLFGENALYLDFVNPHEMYDKVVVLDAGHGGANSGGGTHGLKEKEFTLSVVERVQEKLTDSGIRVYCTRQKDENVDMTQRIEFINELRPDFVVSVHLNRSEDAAKYGTEVWYSKDYVIPIFGNPELADALERNVVLAIDGRANGLRACSVTDEDSAQAESEKAEDAEVEQLLNGVRVPAAVVRVGYMTNERERELLKLETYQDKAAEGICNSIKEVWQ